MKRPRRIPADLVHQLRAANIEPAGNYAWARVIPLGDRKRGKYFKCQPCHTHCPMTFVTHGSRALWVGQCPKCGVIGWGPGKL
jgi:hypothetical protein